MNQKRPLFYSVMCMSKTIAFRKRYELKIGHYSVMCMSKTIAFRKRYELKIGHFGEIRLTDEVFGSYGPTLLKLVYYYWILGGRG